MPKNQKAVAWYAWQLWHTPLWLSWHRGIGQALRAVCLVSGLRPVMGVCPRSPE